MPPKIDENAIKVRDNQVIIDPSKLKPFVFFPIKLSKENLIVYKTYEGKIIIYEDVKPPRSAKSLIPPPFVLNPLLFAT